MKHTTSCDNFFHYYLATSTTNWAQIATGLLFYADVQIHQVRRLVVDNYHRYPVSLILFFLLWKAALWYFALLYLKILFVNCIMNWQSYAIQQLVCLRMHNIMNLIEKPVTITIILKTSFCFKEYKIIFQPGSPRSSINKIRSLEYLSWKAKSCPISFHSVSTWCIFPGCSKTPSTHDPRRLPRVRKMSKFRIHTLSL